MKWIERLKITEQVYLEKEYLLSFNPIVIKNVRIILRK